MPNKKSDMEKCGDKPDDSGDETASSDEQENEQNESENEIPQPQVADEAINSILDESEAVEKDQHHATPHRRGKQKTVKSKKTESNPVPENFWRLYEKLQSDMRSLKRRHAPDSSPESVKEKSLKITLNTEDAYDRPSSSGYQKKAKVTPQLSTGKNKQLSSAANIKQSTSASNTVRLSPARSSQQLRPEQRSQPRTNDRNRILGGKMHEFGVFV